jgi:protein translocase SecG subunit
MDSILLSWFQIILSLVLVGLVLLQNRGEDGLGSGFGSGGGGSFHKRRGLERMVFIATICVSALFFITSILLLLS